MAYLVVRSPHAQAARVQLKGPVILGRAAECDVWIADPRLSRMHCRVEADADGNWTVTDLGSRNGTLVGGQKVEKHLLADGQDFEIGDTRLTFINAMLSERPADPAAAGLYDSGVRPVTPAPGDPGESVAGTRYASRVSPGGSDWGSPSDSTLMGHSNPSGSSTVSSPPTALPGRPAGGTPKLPELQPAVPLSQRRRISPSVLVFGALLIALLLGAWGYFLLS